MCSSLFHYVISFRQKLSKYQYFNLENKQYDIRDGIERQKREKGRVKGREQDRREIRGREKDKRDIKGERKKEWLREIFWALNNIRAF